MEKNIYIKKKRSKKKNVVETSNEPTNKDMTPNIQVFIEDEIITDEPNSSSEHLRCSRLEPSLADPLPNTVEALSEPAKKRGRKPKGGKLTLNCQKKNEAINSIANIILHLKCSINDLSEYNCKLNKMVKYPLEYDPTVPPDIYTYSNMDNATPFSIYEQERHTNENTASSIIDQCMLQTPTSYLDSINYSRLNEPTELELGRFTEGYRPGVKHNNDGERSSVRDPSASPDQKIFDFQERRYKVEGLSGPPTIGVSTIVESLQELASHTVSNRSFQPGTDHLQCGGYEGHSTQLLNSRGAMVAPLFGTEEKFGAKDGVIGAFLSFSEARENNGRLAHMDPTNLDSIRPSLGEQKVVNRDIPAYTNTAFFTQKNQHLSVLGGTIATEVATDIAKAECDTTNIKDINAKLKRLKIHLYKNHNYEKKSACFWCTYDYDNPTCYIPKYEMDDKIYGYGSFCRPECAVAYLMKENIDDSMKFERYHLLNQIYSKIYDFKKNIKPAPNPYYLLEKYYGNLTIQEYRKLLKTEHMLLDIDKPLTRILPELHEDNEDILLNTYASGNSNHTVQNNTGVYKVKRSSDKAAGPSKSSIIKDIFT